MRDHRGRAGHAHGLTANQAQVPALAVLRSRVPVSAQFQCQDVGRMSCQLG
jgi:hypothetical protein